MKYPKIDEDNDLRRKLTVKSILKILHNIGISNRMMGRLFGVDKSTISSHLLLPKVVREKRYESKMVRENPQTRHKRREFLIEKMLKWEREICKNRRKDRKRPYRPILTIRNIK